MGLVGQLMRRGKSEGVGEVINEFGEGLVKSRGGKGTQMLEMGD